MRRFVLLVFALTPVAIFSLCPLRANAQLFRGRFGQRGGDQQRPRLRQQQEEIVAASGSPFGVGRITVQLPAGGNDGPLQPPTLTLTEKNGRALYSAVGNTPVRAVLREALGRPQMATVYFLFTGDEPLDLTLYGPTGIARQVTPQADAQLHGRLLDEWWRDYTAAAARANRSNEYPHLVDVYLTSMLSRRLSLPASEVPRRPLGGLLGPTPPDLDQTIGLALGTEPVRLAIERKTMLSDSAAAEPADQPLPQPVQFPALDIPEPPTDVAIEPLALRVPDECFYLRYGAFVNYQWFRATLDPWGGDLRNLIALRGLDYGVTPRVERQLSLHESALAPLLGPSVIADMALIGDDPFLREGAAIGMIFQARSNFALSSDILGQRRETLGREKDATDQKVSIAGHDVSFLSTPDNRVRSFYATDGDFHLVTTSRRMVERFFEAGKGIRPLGKARDFRHARGAMPAADNYTVFIYASEAFFRQLASPHYQIEMRRRLQSITDIELFEMAHWAAKAERQPAGTVEQLIAGGYLPKNFSARADGSRLDLRDGGLAIDSMRGAHGTFLPVPDATVDRVTASEAAAYEKFSQSFPTAGQSIGPLMVGVRRGEEKQTDRDHVVLDIHMIPLSPRPAGSQKGILGPIGRQRVAPQDADVVSVELSLKGGPLLSGDSELFGRLSGNGLLGSVIGLLGIGQRPANGPNEPYHFFAGVRNSDVPLGPAENQRLQAEVIPGPGDSPADEAASRLQNVLPAPQGAAPGVPTLAPPQGASGILGGGARLYFGAWPNPGLLQSLGLVGQAQPDADGYAQSGSFWTRQFDQFTVASRQRDLLAEVTANMKLADAPRPAQVWLHVGDVSSSKLSQLANTIGYIRARHITRGNSQFLHSLVAQLGVPADKALDVAQRLVDARLVSPLGGVYELQSPEGEFPTWTASPTGSPLAPGGSRGLARLLTNLSPPADFETPPLEWFRGLDLDCGSTAAGFYAHAELEMERPALDSAGKRIPRKTSRPPDREARKPTAPIPPPPQPGADAPSDADSQPKPDSPPELKSVLKPRKKPQ